MRAIDIFLHAFDGNQTAAANAIGVKQQNIWYWLNESKTKDLPLELIPDAAKAIGKKPQDLRPDFFKESSL